ncbi:transmembrane amino acid transporter family protein [Striga asiatica]|uniref:Transmembrane amino acid transporter family protein n=1 Tax=Striga asiatica TaxID=4170 RepID=A0A5A7R9X1_STRAF|nr:transmembrane amino acid transporter family protein [Striga asiatica]
MQVQVKDEKSVRVLDQHCIPNFIGKQVGLRAGMDRRIVWRMAANEMRLKTNHEPTNPQITKMPTIPNFAFPLLLHPSDQPRPNPFQNPFPPPWPPPLPSPPTHCLSNNPNGSSKNPSFDAMT